MQQKTKGWVLLHKKIWDNPLFNGNPYAVAVWLWLITHCNEEGIVTCGRQQIARDTGVKPATVRYWTTRFLQQNYQLATLQTTNKFTQFRICNWHEYQKPTTSKTTAVLHEDYSKTTTNNKEINNISTNVDISSTSVDNKRLFYELVGILGFSDKVQYTTERQRKLKMRQKRYSADDLRGAAGAITNNPYMQGDNPQNTRYGTIDYLIRNDENVDKYLVQVSGTKQIDLAKLEVPA